MFRSLRRTLAALIYRPSGERHWEAADTHRLNAEHWSRAADRSINYDLSSQLQIVRMRCAYEAANNPMLDGVIFTHATDVAGEDGPSLQVLSDDEGYNDEAERLWRDFWMLPDYNGQLTGVELLQLWIRDQWINGEYLAQMATWPAAAGPVKTRLRAIHPRRLATPLGTVGQMSVAMGIRRDATGRPISYFVAREQPFGDVAAVTGEFYEIPAAEILHGFRTLEADQVRGVPWLSSVLPVVADMRKYDQAVLDAALSAALFGVLLTAKDPSADLVQVNESVDLERMTMRTVPVGYEVNQVTPQQPTTTYPQYREERQREFGRPVNMPAMMVRLDSRHHNYSSARFDSQIYVRGIRVVRRWLQKSLTRLFEAIAREGELGRILPRRPGQVRLNWIWPAFPHVDPSREAQAENIRLGNLSLSLTQAVAGNGRDLETHIAELRREREMLAAAGLNAGTGDGKGSKEIDDEEDEEKENPPAREAIRRGNNGAGRLSHVLDT